MADNDPQEWPRGIDPLIETQDLENALASRTDGLVIAYAKEDNDGVMRTHTMHYGDKLRTMGLAAALLIDIYMMFHRREPDA